MDQTLRNLTGLKWFMKLNLFIPKFLKWILPALNLDRSTVANGGVRQKTKDRMANNVDPGETPGYE